MLNHWNYWFFYLVTYALFQFSTDTIAGLNASLLMIIIPIINYSIYKMVKDNKYQYFTILMIIIQTMSLIMVGSFICLIFAELYANKDLLLIEPPTLGWIFSVLYILSLFLLGIRITIDLYKVIKTEPVVIYRFYWHDGTITTSDQPIDNYEEIANLMHVQKTFNNIGRYDYIRVNNHWKPNY